MTVLVVAEAFVIVLLTILVVGMLRSHAEILRKLHELGAGEDGSAPFRTVEGVAQPRTAGAAAFDVSGATPAGGAVGIRVRQPRAQTLLAFMSTTCSTCDNFWPRFGEPAALEMLRGARLVIVAKGQEEELPALLVKLAPDDIPLVMSTQAWEDYQVPGSPYFVMVDGDSGTVTGEGSAGTWDKLLDLMGIADGDVAPPGARLDDRDRAERVDHELADAGIQPGDPQLYGQAELWEDGQ